MRFIVLLLLLSSTSLAQLQVTTKIASQIQFTSQPRLIGNTLLFDTKSKGEESVVAFITVTGPSETIDIVAERFTVVDGEISTETAEVTQVGDREYSISGKGTYSVSIVGFGPGISRVPRFKVALEPPKPPVPPKPPEPPKPDVPPDAFDNIGQRVATWATGLPKTKEVSAVYAKYALELQTNPRMEIVAAFTQASKERIDLLGTDGPKYNAVTESINADLKTRGAMAKGTIADYFNAISAGYAGAK
jgi:hypothetical protein